MRIWRQCRTRLVGLSALVIALMVFSPTASAKVNLSFGVNIGPQPICPYGYYGFAPYNCAPYGYYGPEWFSNGFFIGSGPWFHGPRNFYGHVDNHFDPRDGYRGPFPERERRDFRYFHGNEWRDGHDHVRQEGHRNDRDHHDDRGHH